MKLTLELTRELHQKIVAGVRSGGYPHIAAAAWGVRPSVFDGWLRLGRDRPEPDAFTAFEQEVREAEGQARLKAEMTAFEKDPKVWLEHGPGRERPHQPGWSAAVKPYEDDATAGDVLVQREMMGVLNAVHDGLEAFPDARGHLQSVLATKLEQPRLPTLFGGLS